MDINEFLSRLKNVKKSGSGWTTRSPAHDDDRNSLSVSCEDKKILVYCHAGCSVNNICAALGLELKDLFLERKQNPLSISSGGIVAIYDYRDVKGELLFQVCRTADKRFFQRRPDGKGGWVNGLGNVKPMLYRLPELM